MIPAFYADMKLSESLHITSRREPRENTVHSIDRVDDEDEYTILIAIGRASGDLRMIRAPAAALSPPAPARLLHKT